MSYGKGMKKIDKLQRLLQQNRHGIRIVDASRKLDLHRSTIYKYLNSLELRGQGYFERGIPYPEKPIKDTSTKVTKLGFFDYLDRRAARKVREREKREAFIDSQIDELQEDL
jgi:hypothetical protein